MQTGTKISGAAHLILIGWAMFGGAFRSDPLPFDVQQVSVISAEEFAAMTATRQAPELGDQMAALPVPKPDQSPDAPEVTPDAVPEQTPPEQAPEPQAETPPVPVEEAPTPEAEVTETAPVIVPPDPAPADSAAVTPTPPKPRPVDRVAPTPVAPPPPDARPDDVAREEVTPDEGADTPQEVQEATAPEEAADRIVTEATETAETAPLASPRPKARPQRPAPPAPAEATRAAETAPQPAERDAAVNDALVAALGGTEETAPVPSGPPLTAGEKDSLRVAVSACWNVGSLSSAALQTTVTVAVTMGKDGRPDAGSIRMIGSDGGSGDAVNKAYEAARRAIIRCGASGYALPPDKYGQWREIEMTFNPERMRIK